MNYDRKRRSQLPRRCRIRHNHGIPPALLFILILPLMLQAQDIAPPALPDNVLELLRAPGQDSADPPMGQEEMFKKAQGLLQADSIYAAKSLLKDLLFHYPGDADAMLALGRIHAWHREFSEAEELLRLVIRFFPDYWDAYLALSDMYRWQGRDSEALSILDSAAETALTDPLFLLARSRLLVSLRRFPEARVTLRAAEKAAVDKKDLKPLWDAVQQSRGPSAWTAYALYEETDFDLLSKTSWHRSAAGIKYQHGDWTRILEVQQVQRFGLQDRSIAFDNYISLPDGSYFNARLQWAPEEVLLPLLDLNAEYYKPLAGLSEWSLGYRLMYFTGSPVHLASLGASLYAGNALLRMRFISIYRDGVRPEHVLIAAWRQYLISADHWLEAMLSVSELSSSAPVTDKPMGSSLRCEWYFNRHLGMQAGLAANLLSGNRLDRGFSLGISVRW